MKSVCVERSECRVELFCRVCRCEDEVGMRRVERRKGRKEGRMVREERNDMKIGFRLPFDRVASNATKLMLCASEQNNTVTFHESVMRELIVPATFKLLTTTCCLVAVRHANYRLAVFHTLCPRESASVLATSVRSSNTRAYMPSQKIAPSKAHFHVTEITGEQDTVHTGDTVGCLQDRCAFRAAHFFFFHFFFHQQLTPLTHTCL